MCHVVTLLLMLMVFRSCSCIRRRNVKSTYRIFFYFFIFGTSFYKEIKIQNFLKRLRKKTKSNAMFYGQQRNVRYINRVFFETVGIVIILKKNLFININNVTKKMWYYKIFTKIIKTCFFKLQFSHKRFIKSDDAGSKKILS